MADEVRVRVAGRSFGYQGETYGANETLEVSEDTLENHPRTLERVESGETEAVDADDDPDSGETESGEEPETIAPSDYTLNELEGALDGTDADAETLHDLESEGDDRKGAHEIIDAVAGE